MNDRVKGNPKALALIALLLGLALMVAHALTKIPHVDEGDLASAAVSLLERSRIAFPMSWHYPVSIREHYYSAPFYYWVLAAWFKVGGSSIESYRLFHVAWYVLLVLAWARVARGASTARFVVPIAVAAIALNYDVINLSVSRYDIVCAALNAAAMGSYVALRERRLVLAIFVANLCLACSAITHPYAIFGLVGCIALLVATGDLRRLRLPHVLAGLAPYALAFGLWALTISDWQAFNAQRVLMMSNKRSSGAFPETLWTDTYIRWWQLFAGWRDDVPVIMRAKTAFLALWAAALVAVVPLGSAEGRPIRIAMLVYSVAALVMLPFVDSMHLQIYNIHPITGLAATTAVVLAELAERGTFLRLSAGAATVGMALFAIAAIGFRVRESDLRREFNATIAVVERELPPSGYAIAPASFGFALDYWHRMRSDRDLQSLTGGPLPDVVVESMEHGFRVTPSRPPCLRGAAVHDTTVYVEIPVNTPRHYYRVLRRRQGAPLAADSAGLVVTRDCPGA